MRRNVPPGVRPLLLGLVAGAVLLAACGEVIPDVGGNDPAGSPVPASTRTTIDEACRRVVGALLDGDTVRLVSSLEDIDAALSTDGDATALREDLRAAADALGVDEDLSPTEAELAAAAPSLVALSDALHAAGMPDCAGIGEVAAGYVGPVPVDAEVVVATLAAHRGRWAGQGLDTYAFELNYHSEPEAGVRPCGVDGLLLVQVVAARPTAASDRLSGCRLDLDVPGSVPLTVEALFDLVAAAEGADVLEVVYDPALGYPRSIFVQGEGGVVEATVRSLTPGIVASPKADAVLAELETRRQTWAAAAIDDYTITVRIECFCPEEYRGPFRVTVAGGAITAVTRNGVAVVAPVDRSLLTVEGLFATIERHAGADEIDVTYAPAGYPIAIRIDPDRMTMDEELGVQVLELVPGS